MRKTGRRCIGHGEVIGRRGNGLDGVPGLQVRGGLNDIGLTGCSVHRKLEFGISSHRRAGESGRRDGACDGDIHRNRYRSCPLAIGNLRGQGITTGGDISKRQRKRT